MGPYPPHLRQRIKGGFGHLANEETAKLAASLLGTRLAVLHLGHIALRNNSPERALAVVRPRCVGIEVHAVPTGVARRIDGARSGRRAYAGRGEQLRLALG